jgi:hypothetical protein
MSLLIEIQYFGCITYYVEAIKLPHITIEQYESYQKMSFRNRTQVLTAGKLLNLTVPLLGGRDQKTLITEVLIDNSCNWQLQQWRTLESCYNKSPFFLYYADSLYQLLFNSYDRLWDLNLATINWVLGKLKTPVALHFTKQFEKEPSHEIIDLRNRFLPANRHLLHLQKYQQVFEVAFQTNLSVLDLLFNLGPGAVSYLLNQQISSSQFV